MFSVVSSDDDHWNCSAGRNSDVASKQHKRPEKLWEDKNLCNQKFRTGILSRLAVSFLYVNFDGSSNIQKNIVTLSNKKNVNCFAPNRYLYDLWSKKIKSHNNIHEYWTSQN